MLSLPGVSRRLVSNSGGVVVLLNYYYQGGQEVRTGGGGGGGVAQRTRLRTVEKFVYNAIAVRRRNNVPIDYSEKRCTPGDTTSYQ